MQTPAKFQSLRYLLLGSALLALSGLTACSPDATTVQENPPADQEPLVSYASGAWPHPADTLNDSLLPTQEQITSILKDWGYSRMEFEGKSVRVDGDMIFHRSDFLPDSSSEATPALGKVAQRVYSLGARNRVNRSKPIRIYIHPSLPWQWAYTAGYAMAFWRTWGKFNFERVNSPLLASMSIWPDRHIYGIAESSRPRVIREKPLYVAPGNLIKINVLRDHDIRNNHDRTLATLIHHFGHSLGFTHTDRNDAGIATGVLVPESPGQDPFSVMNSDHYSSEASYYDKWAIHYMYP